MKIENLKLNSNAGQDFWKLLCTTEKGRIVFLIANEWESQTKPMVNFKTQSTAINYEGCKTWPDRLFCTFPIIFQAPVIVKMKNAEIRFGSSEVIPN